MANQRGVRGYFGGGVVASAALLTHTMQARLDDNKLTSPFPTS